jgi:hypothetical protein
MIPTDPTLYVAVYGLLVFLLPWSIFGSYVMRSLMYARNHDIGVFSWIASQKMRRLRQRDNYAAFLHQEVRRWLFITLVMWIVGSAVLAAALYLLHQQGIV